MWCCRRVEKEKEKQELQRQGLLEPAKPKVKLSTFYRSMGAEASADPTRVEQEVREAQEARMQVIIFTSCQSCFLTSFYTKICISTHVSATQADPI